ncbi:MAG: nucleotidyl transferase AbiEii/AbiGii toxin family protein [Methanomassiliicoccales archaeon]
MISVRQLREISRKTGLNLCQQEKDYFLKMFLFTYYRTHQGAVFKGGTCLRYLFGIERFSEDLDFNLIASPELFAAQVKKVLKDLELIGIASRFTREESLEQAFSCEIGFAGPLFMEDGKTKNKIRIDAGTRTGMRREPNWRLIPSEYPETKDQFLLLAMGEEEMLVEKAIALMERKKGRDLYDVWFLLKRGLQFDRQLFIEKSRRVFRPENIISKEGYERDMKPLMRRVIPYEQVAREVIEGLAPLQSL